MTISEIKKWAKGLGYDAVKNKDDNQYYWAKLDCNDPNASGAARSVSKLATAIYNHMTNNKWIEHQEKYQENLQFKKTEISEY